MVVSHPKLPLFYDVAPNNRPLCDGENDRLIHQCEVIIILSDVLLELVFLIHKFWIHINILYLSQFPSHMKILKYFNFFLIYHFLYQLRACLFETNHLWLAYDNCDFTFVYMSAEFEFRLLVPEELPSVAMEHFKWHCAHVGKQRLPF